MADPVFVDRVQESTTTTGTGTYTLGGATTGFQSWAAVGNGKTAYYMATDGTNWEVGLGTYTSSGTTLARTTILASSNSGSAVSWSAGTKTVSQVEPALFFNGLVNSVGTWTPGVSFGGAAVGVTYTLQSGNYVKIGKMVAFSGVITLSSKGSSAGIVSITGFPFTTVNANNSQITQCATNTMTGLTGAYWFDSGAGFTGRMFASTGRASLTDANFTNTTSFSCSGCFEVD